MNKTIRALSTAALLAAPLTGWPVFDPVNDDTDIFLANPAFTAVRPKGGRGRCGRSAGWSVRWGYSHR